MPTIISLWPMLLNLISVARWSLLDSVNLVFHHLGLPLICKTPCAVAVSRSPLTTHLYRKTQNLCTVSARYNPVTFYCDSQSCAPCRPVNNHPHLKVLLKAVRESPLEMCRFILFTSPCRLVCALVYGAAKSHPSSELPDTVEAPTRGR
jgi:hypothetical protein